MGIQTGDQQALDYLIKLIFEEFDPLLSGEMWHDISSPLHDTFLSFP